MKIDIKIPLYLALSAGSAIAEPAWNGEGALGYATLPSAQLGELGDTSFSYYYQENFYGMNFQFQASDRLSLGVTMYNDDDLGKERGLNVKYQILQEGDYMPALAIGAEDVFGRGAYSGEYVVATKGFGAFEGSLGLGWGKFSGSESVFENGERPSYDPNLFDTEHLFSGKASLFGGISYQTPIKGLSLSADYLAQEDGNDIAYGISYRPWERLGMNVYSKGEDGFGFSVTLLGNPNKPVVPQDLGAPPITVVPRAALGTDMSTSWSNTAGLGKAMGVGLKELVEKEGGALHASKVTSNQITLEIAADNTQNTPKIIGRIMRAMAMSAPGSIERFQVNVVNDRGMPVSATAMNRTEFEGVQEHPERIAKSYDMVDITGAKPLSGADVYVADIERKRFDFGGGARPDFSQTEEGGFSITPYANARIELFKGLSFNTQASLNLMKNEGQLKETSAPVRIRSDIPLYKDNTFLLERLTLDYEVKLGGDLYGRTSMGLLETQYAGIDGELLYAPPELPIALGLNIARVQKRDPEAMFGLLDYETTTGFGTLYWDTGFAGTEASIGYGRYLGGDWGTSLSIARKFRNGWRVEGGVNMSEQFADTRDGREYQPYFNVTLPLRWTYPADTRRSITIPISSSSDYAAKLKSNEPLYPSIRDYDAPDYELRWGGFWQ